MDINERIEAALNNEAITRMVKQYPCDIEKPMSEGEKAVYLEAMERNAAEFAEVVIQDALLDMDD